MEGSWGACLQLANAQFVYSGLVSRREIRGPPDGAGWLHEPAFPPMWACHELLKCGPPVNGENQGGHHAVSCNFLEKKTNHLRSSKIMFLFDFIANKLSL
jgi:hypothetical protein